MSARTGRTTRFSVALVLVGYIGSGGVLSAAPAARPPETATAARTHAELTRNREAFRKMLTAPARRALATHGIPGHAMAAPTSGATLRTARGTTAFNPQTVLNRPRIAPAAGTLGGALASNTLTPFHHSPAAPVLLGGAPVRRNAGYSAIDGSVFHHKP